MAVERFLIVYFVLCLFSSLCYVVCELNLPEDSPCITKGLNGTCVNIFKCDTAAHTYLYTNAGFLPEKFPEFPDICSYKDNETVVCCTDCKMRLASLRDMAVAPLGVLVEKQDSIAVTKCYEYFQNLPYSCRGRGVVKFERKWDEEKKCYDQYSITQTLPTGGRDAERWEFPHMALIGYGEDVESAQWQCGGSVISDRFILTAAHCCSTVELGNISFAALGLLKRSDPKKYWKKYKIKSIITHPEYMSPSKYHDIALLETKTTITFGKDLLPACLNIDQDFNHPCEASGWGRLRHGKELADTLQVIEVEPFAESECAKISPPHRHTLHGYDHQTQMCYGSHTKRIDTCEGDSGSPLQHNQDGVRCLFHVIGVTSHSKGCGFLGSAGMYTRVSYYVPWIESVVWPEETEERRKRNQVFLDIRHNAV